LRIKPDHASLIDILERLLDQGIVMDAWLRFAPAGIDLLTTATPVAVASVQTYLRYVVEPARVQIHALADAPFPLAPGELHVKARFIDILDRVLDKGVVMDPWDRIHLMGLN